MSQDPVYKDLIAAKSLNRLKHTLEVNWSLNYYDPEPHFLFRENFRTRILRDFYARPGQLIEPELDMAMWYFSRDFRISQLFAEESLHHTKNYSPDSEQRKKQLWMANENNQRAGKALEAAKVMNGQDFNFRGDYESCLVLLKDFKRRMYLATEFFNNWEIIAELEKEKERAIKSQQFERIPGLLKMLEINRLASP